MFPSFSPGSTDRPDRGGAAAVGAGSCSLHLFLQEEVRSPVILKSNTGTSLHRVQPSSLSWLMSAEQSGERVTDLKLVGCLL